MKKPYLESTGGRCCTDLSLICLNVSCSVQFGDLRIAPLLFADDVVLLASLDDDT